MPIPTPRKDEKKESFLKRCMANDTMVKEYPKRDQRYAICQDSWDSKKASESTDSYLAADDKVSYTKGMSKHTQEDNKRIAFPIQLFDNDGRAHFADEGKKTTEIHVIPTGKWTHWSGIDFEITPDSISEIVKHFRNGARKDIPITAGHDFGNETPAVGWFKELYDRGANGLYALVEWTEEGMRLLKEKSFKYFSAEINFDYRDLETDVKYDILLVGGALTNKPFFKQLDKDPSFGFAEGDQGRSILQLSVPQIMNQFNDDNMVDLNTILTKKADELTDEDKQALRDNEESLTDEQKETFKDVLDGSGEGDGNGDGDGADENGDGDDGGSEGDGDGEGAGNEAGDEGGVGDESAGNAVNASEGKQVTLSAAEHAALVEKANKGASAFADLEKMRLGEQVTGMMFSQANPKGHFLPKQKDAVVKFMVGLSETQRDQFRNIVNEMPQVQQVFGELGDNGSTIETDVSKKVELAVNDKMKATEGLSYSEALKQVFSENPELAQEYETQKVS